MIYVFFANGFEETEAIVRRHATTSRVRSEISLRQR